MPQLAPVTPTGVPAPASWDGVGPWMWMGGWLRVEVELGWDWGCGVGAKVGVEVGRWAGEEDVWGWMRVRVW